MTRLSQIYECNGYGTALLAENVIFKANTIVQC